MNAGKSKVLVMNGEEGLECESHVDGIRLEHVLEFKYLGFILDESGIDEPEYRRKVSSLSMVAGSIRSLVNARDLQLECARVLHVTIVTLLVPFFMYGSETMLWKEKRGLELGLCRWITSGDCRELGGWIESRMHG